MSIENNHCHPAPDEYGIQPSDHAEGTCYEEDGRLIIECGEYGMQVNYCPWCGRKAEVQLEVVESDVHKK